MQAAMFSYNPFIENERIGWKSSGENSLFLVQDIKRKERGLILPNSIREMSERETVGVINKLWWSIRSHLNYIDAAVFYVGNRGFLELMQLVSISGLNPNRVIFVSCGCESELKERVFEEFGFSESRVVPCECGGKQTMAQFYSHFLSKGCFPKPEVAQEAV